MSFESLWETLLPIGRDARSGGYRRFAWTDVDLTLREWFEDEAGRRGMDLVTDRAGNQWAWWGDPDSAANAGRPGLVIGSHLDSVPDGGAFDGPLGVVSAFAAVDALRGKGVVPSRPIGVVNFVDEEGARFGVACAGSRLLTGQLSADRARSLVDEAGSTMAEAMARAGHDAEHVGPDSETLRRVGIFIELHIEQGRGLVDLGHPVGVAHSIVPHGRWRLDFSGEANHAGTTRLEDRNDASLGLARAILAARTHAMTAGCVATVGKVHIEPNGVNAIPAHVAAWLDVRGDREPAVRGVPAAVAADSGASAVVEESYTAPTVFPADVRNQLCALLDDAPILPTGAGHDAGILAQAGIPTGMLFVRNPTGVSHSPDEHAGVYDCLRGVHALAAVAAGLTASQRDAEVRESRAGAAGQFVRR